MPQVIRIMQVKCEGKDTKTTDYSFTVTLLIGANLSLAYRRKPALMKWLKTCKKFSKGFYKRSKEY